MPDHWNIDERFSLKINLKKYKEQLKVDNYSYLGPEFNNNEILKIINQKELSQIFKINFYDGLGYFSTYF